MGKKLYCGNLDYNTSRDDLERLFADFGPLTSIEVAVDSGQGCGFGFVEFEREADALAAEEALDGVEVGGRTMIVNVSYPWTDRCPGGGGPAGGRGGDVDETCVSASADA